MNLGRSPQAPDLHTTTAEVDLVITPQGAWLELQYSHGSDIYAATKQAQQALTTPGADAAAALARVPFGGLVCLLAFIFQPSLVFFPDRRMGATPAQLGVRYKDVFFDTEDGVKLNGWYIPTESARGVLVFCHGNAANISNRLESIQIFLELGLSVFIFDYRGYGRSDGKISEAGTYLDARAAVDYLLTEEGVPADRLILFGRSLGAAVAVELATRRRPRALILESAFTSIADVGQRTYPFLPVKWLSRIKYDSTSYGDNVCI